MKVTPRWLMAAALSAFGIVGGTGWFHSTTAHGQEFYGSHNSTTVPVVPVTESLTEPYFIDGVPAELVGLEPVASPAWPSIRYRYTTDDGIGYNDGYHSLESLIPVMQTPGDSVTFVDLRGILNNNGNLGANIGLGRRQYLADWDRTFGGYIYYDFRETDFNDFHQTTFGLETLGRYLDWRTNVYVPWGDKNQGVNSTTGFFFSGNQLFRRTGGQFESALTGFDSEIGFPLPVLENLGFRAHTGLYLFDGEGTDPAWGFRGRLEAQLFDHVAVMGEVFTDQVFDSNAVFSVAFTWPAKTYRGVKGSCAVADRLLDPVDRLHNIVINEYSRIIQNEALINPTTGLAYNFIHVSSTPLNIGRLGTFERPLAEIGDAESRSAPGDIIIVRQGTYDTGITLQDDQRLLGEGLAHFVDSQFGRVQLPLQVNNTPSAVIIGDTVAITLSNNNEVRGFNISTSGDTSAIFGNRVNNALIRDNIIAQGGTLGGIVLSEALGRVIINDNIIAPGTQPSLLIRGSDDGDLNLELFNNQIQAGAILQTIGRQNMIVAATNNVFGSTTGAAAGQDGLTLSATDIATIQFTGRDNRFVSAANGLNITTLREGRVDANLFNNSFLDNTLAGVNLVADQFSQINLILDNNRLQGNNIANSDVVSDFTAEAIDPSFITLQLTNNTLDAPFLFIQTPGENDVLGTVRAPVFENNSQGVIRINN